MKKLEHKLLPCVFCTIGLNTYIAGHNLVQATIQKLTPPSDASPLKEPAKIATDDTPAMPPLNSK